MKTIKTIFKWLFILTGASAIIMFFLAWLIGSDHGSGTSSTSTAQTASTQQTGAVTVSAAAQAAMPTIEAQFIAAVDAGARQYSAGANDMAKGAARPARAHAICAVLSSPTVSHWTGTVEKLSSNSDGKGVLEIKVSPIAYVKTWNNSLSDSSDQTLIEPSSALFQQASALAQGQAVVFSGRFLPSQVDCVKEPSMTISGSMTEPEFLFRFTAISPAN